MIPSRNYEVLSKVLKLSILFFIYCFFWSHPVTFLNTWIIPMFISNSFLLSLFHFTLTMGSKTHDETRLTVSDHPRDAIFQQRCSPPACTGSSEPTINIAGPRNVTFNCSRIETVSRPELLNVSFSVSLSPLQGFAGSIYEKEVLNIIRDFNFDTKIFSFQISSGRIAMTLQVR